MIGDGKTCADICKHAPPKKGKWPCEDCDIRFHDRAEKPTNAADAIEELQRINQLLESDRDVERQLRLAAEECCPRWFGVEEKLPEEQEWVLTYRNEMIWPAYRNSLGEWVDEGGIVSYITHWMPLPDPPEEEEEQCES